MNTDDENGTILSAPLSIADLIKDGTQFEINANFDDNFSNELFDDQIGSSDEGDEEVVISPWERSFAELRQQMVKINDDIYKKIVQEGQEGEPISNRARVVIRYNAYWESESAPFDSSYMRGDSLAFHCGQGQVLEGLEAAVRTMLKGEESQFLISYRLLFREMGCPPRVKPKADGLFIIKLVNFVDIGNDNAIDEIPEQDRNKFSVVFEKVKDVHLKGLDLFKQGNISGSCKSFHKAINALEFCRLSNDQEQEEQRKFLVKLYLNLAVCYNRLNNPTKTCCMCNEIRRISNINKNCKALFQEGRALLMIGDFVKSKTRLQQAQHLEPNNLQISQELRLLAQKYQKYKENQETVWKKAFGIVKESDDKNVVELNDFKEEIKKFLEDFSKQDESSQLTLPDGLSSEEASCIAELTKEFGLSLNVSATANQGKSYVISKTK